MLTKLARCKASLTLQIQVAGVGVQKDIEKKVIVTNAEAVKKIDDILQKVLGKGEGLKLAERIRNKPIKDKNLLLCKR